jgi:hypothetical protein
MTDQALKDMDWDSHTMAVGWSQLSQPFLVKMLHQKLPIGMLIHRYDPVKYTIDCPTFCEHREMYDHLFQCCHQLSQPFLVKMLHQILPVGMLIHRYDPVKYTIDCPTCRFQCCHPSRAGYTDQVHR